MFCKQCGTIVEEGEKFCNQCGTAVAVAPQATVNADNKPVAELVRKSFCSPLSVAVAVLVTFFSAVVLIDVAKTASMLIEEAFDAMKQSEMVLISLVLISMLIALLLAAVFSVIGAWVTVYPSVNRMQVGARLAAVGARLYGATMIQAMAVVVISFLNRMVDYAHFMSSTVFSENVLGLVLVLFLFIMITILFFKIAGFYSGASAATMQQPNTCVRSNAMSMAVFCFIVVGFIMILLIVTLVHFGGNLNYNGSLWGNLPILWNYRAQEIALVTTSPWYVAVGAAATLAMIGAFALKCRKAFYA